MKKISIIIVLSLNLCMINLFATSSTVIDTFTEQDKMVLENYKENDLDKPIEDIAIKDYILSKLENNQDVQGNLNGLKLIYRLTDDHRTFFDNHLISFLKVEIRSILSYSEYRSNDGAFIRGLYALGETRTKESIQFLLDFVQPMNYWPMIFRNSIANNDDRNAWTSNIRMNAMNALLEPIDPKGEELLSVLVNLLNSLSSDDEMKEDLLERLDIWKTIYENQSEIADSYLHYND